MKRSRVLLAVMTVAMASCSSPTQPRIPQPGEDRPPPPDQPGVIALHGVEQAPVEMHLRFA